MPLNVDTLTLLFDFREIPLKEPLWGKVLGGGTKVILLLTRELRRRGIRVLWLHTKSSKLKEYLHPFKVYLGLKGDDILPDEILYAVNGRLYRHGIMSGGIFKLSKVKEKYSTFIVNIQSHNLFEKGLTLFVDAHYVHTSPLLTRRESVKRKIKVKCLELLKMLIERRRPLFIANSKYTAREVARAYGDVKRVVIPPPVDVVSFLSEGRRHLQRKRPEMVVCVSRFHPYKNLELVLDVAEGVRGARFVVCALRDDDRYLIKLRREVIKRELDNVYFIVNPRFEDLVRVVSKASLYLHPTMLEAFGIPVVEALSAGTIPIVPYEGGPWQDVLEEGKIGCGFAFRDAREAIDLIRGLICSERESRRLMPMRKRGMSRALLFSPSKVALKWLSLMKASVKGRSHGVGGD